MQIKGLIIFLAMLIAGSASADARFSTISTPPPSLYPLVYAQAQIDGLTDSDLRRLVFYADRATRTLQNLVEGASGRSIIEQDKVNKRFRESISRLADAGARSGLSMDQVADFYTQNVFDTFGQDFMQQVGALAGGLDFRTLFRNVATLPDPRTTVNDEGGAFLDALAEASQDLQLDTPFSENTQVVEVVPTVDGPLALPNANAIERNIVKRVQVNQGRWELTVQAGDSLSTIASALYGDVLSYTTIYSANTAVINNPNVIDVGTVLVLPRP